MICDLAETYHIFNYRELPAKTLAVLVSGLRANSRLKMKLTGAKIPDYISLLAVIYDRITQLVWMNSEDGHKNRNRPASLYEQLTRDPEESENLSFDTPEEFEKAYAAAVGRR